MPHFETAEAHAPFLFGNGPQPNVLLGTYVHKAGASRGGGGFDFNKEAVRLGLIPKERINSYRLFTEEEYHDEIPMLEAIAALAKKIRAVDKKRKGTRSKMMNLLCYIIGETDNPIFKPFLKRMLRNQDRAVSESARQALLKIETTNFPKNHMQRQIIKAWKRRGL